MALPKAKNAEQKAKREASAKANAGPAPEKSYKIPDQPLSPSVSPAGKMPTGGGKGETNGPEGRINVEPLSSEQKAKFEKSFGMDLSAVTVHTGPGADKQCTESGALAFIQGTNIFMSSAAGKLGDKKYERTLGHELAHFAQQNGKATEEGGGDAEADADQAGDKAAAGEAATVSQSVAPGTKQNKDGDNEQVNKVNIPLFGTGAGIEITPPNTDGDWSVAVADVKEFTEGIEEKGDKWWRKSFPTPFFGLSIDLGAGFFAEFSLGKISLKGLKVNYKKARDMYEFEGEVGTAMKLEVGGFISAGVSADVWIASAGVGLKAKLALTKNHPLSVSLKGGWSPSSGDAMIAGALNMSALELECKAAVALYVYYDAWGLSTYSKDWTLYERTLGKLTFAGIKLQLGWSRSKGWGESEIEPKPAEAQDFSGNISSLYPSKSD